MLVHDAALSGVEGAERGGGAKGMKSCISYKFHGLGGGLEARGQLSSRLGRARHVRGLIC